MTAEKRIGFPVKIPAGISATDMIVLNSGLVVSLLAQPIKITIFEEVLGWTGSISAKSKKEKKMPSSKPQKTLFERLGGAYNIAVVIDDFIDRIMTDARLNSNPKVDEAHHRFSPAAFKYMVTEMVCWATGGPQTYNGRPMAEAHRHLGITPPEWEAFMDDFNQTLEKFRVPAAEQAELRAIVLSAYDDIVISPCSVAAC